MRALQPNSLLPVRMAAIPGRMLFKRLRSRIPAYWSLLLTIHNKELRDWLLLLQPLRCGLLVQQALTNAAARCVGRRREPLSNFVQLQNSKKDTT